MAVSISKILDNSELSLKELQNEIASLVGQSLECKQQSRLLQQSAIQMVEEVIEKYRVN